MKALLMHRDRDFELATSLPAQAPQLIQDLGLEVLLNAMAAGDPFLLEIARLAVLGSLGDVAAIRYRQAILRDCLGNPAVVRGMYELVVETIEAKKKHYWGFSTRRPDSILYRSVELLRLLVNLLRQLRRIAEAHGSVFRSEGFRTLFAMLSRELDDRYLAAVEGHIEQLKFRRGPLISARLAPGMAGTDLVLRRPNPDDRFWIQRLLGPRGKSYTFHVHERDEAGGRIVGELKERGLSLVANAAGQAVDHIVSFMDMLRIELAFYIGCLNLHDGLAATGMPICFPDPVPGCERRHSAAGIYDPCLALVGGRAVIGNDLAADRKDLFIITGANQGGKTTWLRGIGLAQLMMQCGLFVAARSFSANLCSGLFVHFRREEDAGMRFGKFEEELQRISTIVDGLATDGMVLFNESLQSTNEREGSEIGRQIVAALLASRIKVFFVTHMYDLAQGLHAKRLPNAIYLRAERRPDGTRSFRILPGAPLATSYAKDVYDEIFGLAEGDRSSAGDADTAALTGQLYLTTSTADEHHNPG
ncbi:MAG: MutS-related protein [Stellaceae bacterium]